MNFDNILFVLNSKENPINKTILTKICVESRIKKCINHPLKNPSKLLLIKEIKANGASKTKTLHITYRIE